MLLLPSAHVPHTCFSSSQGSIHASLASSSKMEAISSALLAAAASEQEESAESILERHVSLVFNETSASVCRSADDSGTQRRTLSQRRPATVNSSLLSHSRSAVEGDWLLSGHRPPVFKTSASFGEGDLPQSVLYSPYLLDLTRTDRDRAVAPVSNTSAAVSKHLQHRHLSHCPRKDADRK